MTTGKRGEAVFVKHLLNYCGNPCPISIQYSWVRSMRRSITSLQLISVETATPFFFVQVKTTKLGYRTDKGRRRLRVRSIEIEHREDTVRYPAPTYVVGVDALKDRSFIVPDY